MTDYEQQLEAAFDAAATQPSRYGVLSAKKFCKGPLTGTPRIPHAYHDAVARGDWKTVNAANDARAKELIAEWSRGEDLSNVMEFKPEAEPIKAANRVQSAAEFMGALAPRAWAIEDIQPSDAQLCGIYGNSGDGKSFLTFDMQAARHRGAAWNGRETIKGRVVYLIAEGAGDFRYRLHAYCRARGVKPADLPLVIDNSPDLFKDENALKVIEQLHAIGGCETLVIDTLSATFTGNENGSDMGTYILNVQRIRKACCATVWIIMHCGKDQTRGIRGWSGMRAALDVEIELTRQGIGADASDVRTARVSKMKGGREGFAFNFRLPFIELGTDAKGRPFGSCAVEYTVDAPTARGKRQPVLSAKYSLALKAVKALIAERGGPVDIEDARAAIKAALTAPAPGEKDRRATRAGEAIEALQDKLQLFRKGDTLSDTDRGNVTEGNWDDT
jgi:AAA domain